MRRIRIGLAAAVALALTGASLPAFAADSAPLGERLVDVMVQLFGQHPGLRPLAEFFTGTVSVTVSLGSAAPLPLRVMASVKVTAPSTRFGVM